MRIQDKIKGHKMTRKTSSELSFAQLGDKNDDELPLPHHSGYVLPPKTSRRSTITKKSPASLLRTF